MKLPKITKKYCKTCKKYTEHKVGLVKVKGGSGTHPLSWGSTKRVRERGLRRGAGNKGRYSKPSGGGKRVGVKASKKVAVKYTCNICKKSQQKCLGRAKKTEFE